MFRYDPEDLGSNLGYIELVFSKSDNESMTQVVFVQHYCVC